MHMQSSPVQQLLFRDYAIILHNVILGAMKPGRFGLPGFSCAIYSECTKVMLDPDGIVWHRLCYSQEATLSLIKFFVGSSTSAVAGMWLIVLLGRST
jgi:hypothetical protein